MANNILKNVARVSRLFQPVNQISKHTVRKTKVPSKSYQLMVDVGIIRSTSTGLYALMPLGSRALQKLINLVEQEMESIEAQKITLPSLSCQILWERTSRLAEAQTELFKIEDRHGNKYILSPTYEETITDLISRIGPLSTKILPLRLYQMSSKWRDEKKPRLGFLRSREFLMKDLYTFDHDESSANETYEKVCESYNRIFDQLNIPFMKVIGDPGMMGDSISHEYHYLSNIGEDKIQYCSKCNHRVNQVINQTDSCPNCNEKLSSSSSIEVAHTFLLGTKYSQPLKANFVSSDFQKKPLVMGCYGLGMTRIMSTALEILSTDVELRWPAKLAPYQLCIIPPKLGSKEESATSYVNDICNIFHGSEIDVIIDDRTEYTIGRRLIDARRAGYPYAIVIGKSSISSNPTFEVHNVYTSSFVDVDIQGIVNYFKNNIVEEIRLKQ